MIALLGKRSVIYGQSDMLPNRQLGCTLQRRKEIVLKENHTRLGRLVVLQADRVYLARPSNAVDS
jgi:hypothetical protein